MTESLEKRAAITGIGVSQVGRRLDRTGLQLTLDACLQAIDDAGLTPRDVDGLASWPGTPETTPGMSPVGLWEVKESLGLELLRELLEGELQGADPLRLDVVDHHLEAATLRIDGE